MSDGDITSNENCRRLPRMLRSKRSVSCHVLSLSRAESSSGDVLTNYVLSSVRLITSDASPFNFSLISTSLQFSPLSILIAMSVYAHYLQSYAQNATNETPPARAFLTSPTARYLLPVSLWKLYIIIMYVHYVCN